MVQYLTHAHSHITRAMATMDRCFALVGDYQNDIAVGSMNRVIPVYQRPSESNGHTAQFRGVAKQLSMAATARVI